MKNHVIAENGKIIQSNKKWIALKAKQKDFIYNLFKEEHRKIYNTNGKTPGEKDKKIILENVYKAIEDKDIWIPFGEVKKFYYSKVNKFNKEFLKDNDKNLNIEM